MQKIINTGKFYNAYWTPWSGWRHFCTALDEADRHSSVPCQNNWCIITWRYVAI